MPRERVLRSDLPPVPSFGRNPLCFSVPKPPPVNTAVATGVRSKPASQASRVRNLLLASIDGLRVQAMTDTEGLMEAVQEAFNGAYKSLTSAMTSEEYNRFVEEFVGPMEILPDGTVQQVQMPPVEVEGRLLSCITGARYDTLQQSARRIM